MSSERAVLVAEIKGRGDRQAAQLRQDAISDSQRQLSEAEATAKGIQAAGQQQAADYLKVFQQDPALANFLLELHALEAALGSKAVLIFDRDTDPFGLLVKPPAATGK
jgi:regulator of protease activity HflC (stomatin/prohibitin superfamily)